MFAVIKTGGKQYKVAKDDVIFVEKLSGDAGAEIRFDEVLMIGDGARRTVGSPTIQGATVTAKVLEQTRGDKVIVFKKRRRKGYRRKHGHRQHVTVLRITNISAERAKRAAAKKTAEVPAGSAQPDSKAERKTETVPEAGAEHTADEKVGVAKAATETGTEKPRRKKTAASASSTKTSSRKKTPASKTASRKSKET